MILFLSHNIFDLNKVSSNLTFKTSPNNLNLSIHCTFFQSSNVQSFWCCAHWSLFNVFFSNRGFLTDRHPLILTKISLLLRVLTYIVCWRGELNSAVSSWAVFLFSFLLYTIKCQPFARGVMVIVVGNGHGDTSSNPGRRWLHFTQH